eukprot:2928120-Rhodomonas_salina.1
MHNSRTSAIAASSSLLKTLSERLRIPLAAAATPPAIPPAHRSSSAFRVQGSGLGFMVEVCRV